MTLTIRRLHVRARVPRRIQEQGAEVVRLAHNVLPVTMAVNLGSRLPSQPAICRIRRLHLRLQLTARELDESHLAAAWAEAFTRALLAAINQPPDNGNTVVAPSHEQWLATAIVALLDGRFSDWMFDEFEHHQGWAAAQVVPSLAREHDADWPRVLATLDASGHLDRLSGALGSTGCRALAGEIARRGQWRTPASVTDLVHIATLVSRGRNTLESGSADVLVLRLLAASSAEDAPSPAFSPDGLRAAAVALVWLGQQLARIEESGPLPQAALPLDELSAAPLLARVLPSIAAAWQRPEQAESRELALLRRLVAPFVSVDAARSPAADIRESAVTGLFLLVRVIDELGWPDNIRRSPLGAQYGSRAVTYVLTGIAQALLGHAPSETSRLDPGVAAFAGWLDSVDPSAVARMCRDHEATVGLALLPALAGDAVDLPSIAGWDSVLAALGSRLVRRFAQRLRGLSRSSERFIVERLLAVPGTIAIDDRHIVVRLHSNPYWPVVRLSGADATIEAVSWLGARRLVVELEGV